MSAPKPPVALKDHCSIIHDGVIYVYSPDAFQTLEIKEGAEWKEEPNGVSVKGAVCVKGGMDGDNTKAALYVVGGAANETASDYPGIQRYSISDNSWQTITPDVAVTQDRQNHGAAYMNASSSLIVYGGSQTNYTGPSSETFMLEMYPPYRVLAYSSTAPPTVSPFMLPWTEDRALMVGGSSSNVNVFTFDPTNGWQDLGLALPNPLPDSSIAQCAVLTLADSSKILQTFQLDSNPVVVTTNVLLNPGGQPATFGEIPGGNSTTTSPSPAPTSPSKMKRDIVLSNYPAYNGTLAPSATRTGFALAQGDDGLVAFVGGDDNDPVVFFNQSENSWVAATQLLGKQQVPLTTPTPSTSQSPIIPTTATTSTATPSGSSDKSNSLTILGAVLGALCGAAAILIVLLLWMRQVRRKRAAAQKQREYPDDKRSVEYNYEEGGLHPLSKAGQPMGRSPVPSAVISEADSTTVVGTTVVSGKEDPKYSISRVPSDRAQHGFRGSGIGFGQALFKREKEKASLTISKPMMPVLGDYKERPSIELGKATPAAPGGPLATQTTPKRDASQRKTDEGWGKYFQAEPQGNRTTFLSRSSGATSEGKSGLWPVSGVLDNSARAPKILLRDSVGNPLEPQSVAAGSPSLEHGPADPQSKGLEAVQGIPARISNGSSVTTTNSDDDYEDERVDPAFSSGIPASITDEMPWTPVGNTWSGPPQRPLRPPSSFIKSQGLALPTASSIETNTSGTNSSSLPSFPMPNSIRSVQPSGGNATMLESTTARAREHSQNNPREYFGHARASSRTVDSNDMSWLNLGASSR